MGGLTRAVLMKSLSKLGAELKAFDSLSLFIDYLLISGLALSRSLSFPLSFCLTLLHFSIVFPTQLRLYLCLRLPLSLNLSNHSRCNQSQSLPLMCITNTYQFVGR